MRSARSPLSPAHVALAAGDKWTSPATRERSLRPPFVPVVTCYGFLLSPMEIS
jgi:hypothetical protein